MTGKCWSCGASAWGGTRFPFGCRLALPALAFFLTHLTLPLRRTLRLPFVVALPFAALSSWPSLPTSSTRYLEPASSLALSPSAIAVSIQ